MECARKDLRNKTQSVGTNDAIFKAMLTVCIVLGTSVHMFSYIALGLTMIYLIFTDNERGVNCVFFLLPFANIFKANSAGSSFFTYLTVFLALKLIISKKSIEKRFLLVWMALFAIQAIGCRGQITLLIKQATVLLLLYGYFHGCQSDLKQVVLNLAWGMLASCIVANMTDVFPGISDYMRVVRAYEVSADKYRFTGLYSDPNYLSEVLIVLCVSLFIFLQQKRIDTKYWAIIVALLAFGTQTISKSFFLMLAVLVILFVVIAFKRRNSNVLIAMALCGTVLIGLALVGKLTLFDNILKRFMSGGDFTTGRVGLWKSYIKELILNPLNILIGFGIGSSLSYMAHNTLLDFIYYYGVLGSIVYAVGIKYAVKERICYTDLMHWAPAICFLMTSFFLSNLLWFDFGYNLILILSFIVEDTQYESKKVGVIGT